MPSLERLSVSNNPQLTSLNSLNGTKSLIVLNASDCQIGQLPTGIPVLVTLDLNHNNLTSLDGLETVTSPAGGTFIFSNNQISSIASDAFRSFHGTCLVDLPDNRLRELPESIYVIDGLQT